MTELKTKMTLVDPKDFLQKIPDSQKQADSFQLLEFFEEVTGEKGKMWGEAIVGFGSYHYKSERSSQEGDWPRTAFSPRKANLTIYIMSGFEPFPELMAKLGKYKNSKSCLYFKKLADLHVPTLKKLIQESLKIMQKRYPIGQKI